MKSILSSTAFKEETIVIEHPEGFIAGNGLLETIVLPEYPGTQGFVKRLTLDGIQIAQREIELQLPLHLHVEHDFPFLKMQFEIEGYSSFKSKIKGVPDVLIEGGCHQLLFLPEVKGDLFYPANRKTLEINLSLDFIERLFDSDLEELEQFGKLIQKAKPGLLFPQSRPIDPQMRHCISDIVNCPFGGKLKKIFLEAKVTELLCMQLRQVRNIGNDPAPLKKKDMESLHFVRETIEQNITSPLTISELSQLAGINDFKLKKGFKELFGDTIFGYLTHLRMEKAKRYILENEYTISEASFLVGYKHPQHFTTAFKKKFGFLPNELRKTG